MTELILENYNCKKTKLSEVTSILVAECNLRNQLFKEGVVDFFNYGVTTRAVDKYFGGAKKLEELVKSQIMKKYGSVDIKSIDPKELEDEIVKKANSAAKKLASKEFISGVLAMFRDGLLNGLINAFVNSILTFFLTLNIQKALESFVRGFIVGIIIEFLFKIIGVVYNEVKKRVLKDPYATPSRGEILALTLLTLVLFTTSYGMYMGASANVIIAMILINIVLSMFLTVLLNVGKISEMIISKFSKQEVEKIA
jgi:hypothetical protein